MMSQIICKYCDYKWVKNIYSASSLSGIKCPSCSDTNLRIKELDAEDKVDFYKGDKPFPKDNKNMQEKAKKDKEEDAFLDLYFPSSD